MTAVLIVILGASIFLGSLFVTVPKVASILVLSLIFGVVISIIKEAYYDDQPKP
jgi:hypothetical protein